MNRTLPFLVAIAGIGVMAVSLALFGVRAPARPLSPGPAFAAAEWPFLLDQWGIGRAFACAPADCGVKVAVYVRPKIGFCNCTTGVSDDLELERVADTDLLDPDAKPLGPGHVVEIGWMKGRSRAYRAGGGAGSRHLLSIAYNNECDVVVAVAAVGNADPAAVEPFVVDFLGSEAMLRWARKELGLEYDKAGW